jgi:hypothetical protein
LIRNPNNLPPKKKIGTNVRVLWWSIAQAVILVLTGYWQLRHLKSFFQAKKIV